ncbi:MAG: hypothetical protein LIP02_06360 [Bacteroidales bacterium]|nr:hypothetical protein [Bacteroidales bacterium]
MYDENNCIKYIQDAIQGKVSRKYSGDDIINIMDIIWDYYEDHGLLDLESDAELDTDDLIASVKKTLSKDKRNKVVLDDVEPIVMAELAFEETLDEKDEEEDEEGQEEEDEA